MTGITTHISNYRSAATATPSLDITSLIKLDSTTPSTETRIKIPKLTLWSSNYNKPCLIILFIFHSQLAKR